MHCHADPASWLREILSHGNSRGRASACAATLNDSAAAHHYREAYTNLLQDQVRQKFPRSTLIRWTNEPAAIQSTFKAFRTVFGEIPILASEQRLLDEAGGDEDVKEAKEVEMGGGEKVKSKPRILADGTYATSSSESAYTTASSSRLEAVKATSKPPLRSETPIHCRIGT